MLSDASKLALKIRAEYEQKALVDLATKSDTVKLIDDLMAKDIPTQLRAFSVVQAKAELIRVIQLTQALNELEDTYIQRALMDKDGMDMKSLEKVLETIVKSLNRSMALIDKVTNDNNLKVIIDQSTKVYNVNNNSNTVLLTDQNSREKLRNLAQQLFSVLSNNPNQVVNATPNMNIVDAEVVTDNE